MEIFKWPFVKSVKIASQISWSKIKFSALARWSFRQRNAIHLHLSSNDAGFEIDPKKEERKCKCWKEKRDFCELGFLTLLNTLNLVLRNAKTTSNFKSTLRLLLESWRLWLPWFSRLFGDELIRLNMNGKSPEERAKIQLGLFLSRIFSSARSCVFAQKLLKKLGMKMSSTLGPEI